MEEPTLILRRYRDDEVYPTPENRLNDGMELDGAGNPCLDLRSSSRDIQQRFRKRRTPTTRWKRCRNDSEAYSHRNNTRSHRRRAFEIEVTIDPFNTCLQDEWSANEHHDFLVDYSNPIRLYYDFGYDAAVFESIRPTVHNPSATRDNDEEVQIGETFTRWAQRRITEMRLVKESRLKSKQQQQQHTETTLPTTSADTHAHYLLRQAWDPRKPPRRHRPANHSPFPQITGFTWFSEYTFTWHRNASGCWELGFGDQCRLWEPRDGKDEYGCRQNPLLDCCLFSHVRYACSCAEFGEDERSPEDVPVCSLMEFVSDEIWCALMRYDDDAVGGVDPAADDGGDEWTFISSANTTRSLSHSQNGAEWDLVSTWSGSFVSWDILST
ncbi:hypothetical protein N0V94_000207 [Neodidymelliopsis sp. IMI 364377]|nr:hypothetical protein N0V94_000207 [Neodidymelliopsis sp. IMI 364377]